jgi:hypothetical protein
LAHYSWTEQDIISLKGEEKKEELFQVQLGMDGKPQKTNLNPDSMSDDERHRRGLRGRIIEKKTEEYKDYGGEMKSLIQQYSTFPPRKNCWIRHTKRATLCSGPPEFQTRSGLSLRITSNRRIP